VGGIPDVAEDGVHALLVPPRDPAALGRAMRRLLDEPALAAGLAERGRARVQERFDVDRIASAYAELLPGSGAEARPLPAGGPASAGRTGRR